MWRDSNFEYTGGWFLTLTLILPLRKETLQLVEVISYNLKDKVIFFNFLISRTQKLRMFYLDAV